MFKPDLAYLSDEDGHDYQVLNLDQTDWNEAATYAAFAAGNYIGKDDTSPPSP